jgi:hypothetical protein
MESLNKTTYIHYVLFHLLQRFRRIHDIINDQLRFFTGVGYRRNEHEIAIFDELK